jgi:hypothetical protein
MVGVTWLRRCQEVVRVMVEGGGEGEGEEVETWLSCQEEGKEEVDEEVVTWLRSCCWRSCSSWGLCKWQDKRRGAQQSSACQN